MFEEYGLIPLLRDSRGKTSLEDLELQITLLGSPSFSASFLVLRRLFDLFSLRSVWLGGCPSPCATLPASVLLGAVPPGLDHPLIGPILSYHHNVRGGLAVFEEVTQAFFSYELARNCNRAVQDILIFEAWLFDSLLTKRAPSHFSEEKSLFFREVQGSHIVEHDLFARFDLDLPNPDEVERAIHLCRLKWLNARIEEEGWFSPQSLIWEFAYHLFVIEWSFRNSDPEKIDLSKIFQEIQA
ncbi:hypothetical protein [Candidatus Similichlamydia laticola]|uniref:Uncharacterized protein n=1 Tax=Candidatus Similichlamydia laticola TaxID=2170265 RepID=A0A369KG85_9BACT|nr:hypothetical protein [Candidatus Similichlamydia laticola]RDB31715.1 hypothetical protein HAT2_00224 [Candidatus Similichlamydia laticola]